VAKKAGNARIGSGRGGISIADPSGADELLQWVVDAGRDDRRVIFFCACLLWIAAEIGEGKDNDGETWWTRLVRRGDLWRDRFWVS
jgi:hypothetical protein